MELVELLTSKRLINEYKEKERLIDLKYPLACYGAPLDSEGRNQYLARRKEIIELEVPKGEYELKKEITALETEIKDGHWDTETAAIELKPCVGDDYPSIIRTLKNRPRHGDKILGYYEYTGRGVNEETFIAILAQENITAMKIER